MATSGLISPSTQSVTFSVAATGAATVTAINGATASGTSFALKFAEGTTPSFR